MKFYQFAPDLYLFFVVTTKKLSSDLESTFFPTFCGKRWECKIWKRDGNGKSRNGHGKVMEKYFAKSVGALHRLDFRS